MAIRSTARAIARPNGDDGRPHNRARVSRTRDEARTAFARLGIDFRIWVDPDGSRLAIV